jgi:acyl dehydratase
MTAAMQASIYFEDLSVGDVFDSASKTITESEIIEFAWKYDPQPFHISKPEAEASMFGGLIASGFLTVATTFRLFYQSNAFKETSAGAHGIDKIKWLKPVRPGDTIRAKMEILALKESRSRPEIGNVLALTSTLNQNDEVVMTMETPWIIKRRGTQRTHP